MKTYTLTNEAKEQILKDHDINFYKTDNSLFIGVNKVSDFSDSTFVSIVCGKIEL